ncbi:MAG: fluoride efflux transporter CrcB, partial [Candidatus Lokiarchaeota archaeon]|nr:fluoride efflux transporter CrcB [Candidatus Lokiarchaeota archaeon]
LYWFVAIGFLSSFTTFSTFVMEINTLWDNNKLKGIEYTVYSLVFGFTVLSLGFILGEQLLLTS